MDKHALRRRNRLLKKNEARMNLLLGKSEEGNVEKDTEDKKKAPDLKPKQSEINQEEGHDEGEKKQPPHTGKDQVETQINSLGQASTADADLHTEDNSKQKGDASSVHEQTQEGKEKEKNDPTGQEEQKGDPEKGPKGGQRGELTNRAKKKRISNHPGDNSDNERDDYTNADDINNPSESNSAKSEEGKINEGAPIATPQFKVSIFRLAQFVSLIFIASINMSQKEIWRNLQNLRERLTSQSESLLYLLNNGTTLASFFVSIVKTYLLLMFLTHLFDDLLYNYTVRKTWASAPLPAS